MVTSLVVLTGCRVGIISVNVMNVLIATNMIYLVLPDRIEYTMTGVNMLGVRHGGPEGNVGR
jgi:hypothetical protein